ncbi:hypothetical protein [Noviherbaspirillum autotrophicum]|uniref:hypothetical protein n=1 Tax=Noviherbaspirillum autotrophicum TaxID=709839 RepID=UPI0038CD36B1
MLVMTTWKEGRHLVYENLQRHLVPLHDFLQPLFIGAPIRVEGPQYSFVRKGRTCRTRCSTTFCTTRFCTSAPYS